MIENEITVFQGMSVELQRKIIIECKDVQSGSQKSCGTGGGVGMGK